MQSEINRAKSSNP